VNIAGRVVAITGAGSGIGAALAREAANRGASAVAVIDIDDAAAGAVAQELTATGTTANAYTCDIADPNAVEQLAEDVTTDLGLPGLVCANAGVSTAAMLLDESPATLNWVLSVNVIGTWATLRAFGRRMATAADPGWLLVTASEHALGVPYPGNGFYTMSKHAVLGLADVLRHELPQHVGISALLPGLVATGMSRSGRHRPPQFGGPVAESEAARALLAQGMDAGVVARAALDGVDKEQFLIATHAHARAYWQRRCTDIDTAFTVLADTDIGDESYDVMEIAARLTH
jgi:NAD(P)-dependent dehydrogenase (short-subunit alcohol dehydrogenase family)